MEIFILVSFVFFPHWNYERVFFTSHSALARHTCTCTFPCKWADQISNLATKGIKKYGVEILRVNWNVNWSHFYTFMFLPLFILFKLLALASEKLCYWFNTKVNVAFWTYLRYLVVENIAKACSSLHGIVSSFFCDGNFSLFIF